jgi:tRNA(Glu) U13 pseudouridine synthase TruD
VISTSILDSNLKLIIPANLRSNVFNMFVCIRTKRKRSWMPYLLGDIVVAV